MSASPEGSPELAPHDKEGKGPDQKGCPKVLGDSLVSDNWGNPQGGAPVSMDVPEAGTALYC